MLARLAVRRTEIAVRTALAASRRRVASQFLAEKPSAQLVRFRRRTRTGAGGAAGFRPMLTENLPLAHVEGKTD